MFRFIQRSLSCKEPRNADSPLVGRAGNSDIVVEEYSNGAVGQLEPEPVLIAVIDPLGYERRGVIDQDGGPRPSPFLQAALDAAEHVPRGRGSGPAPGRV